MMTILSYVYKERIRFFLTVFPFFILLEWFVISQFAPPQSYSYDYLMGLYYFIFVMMIVLCGYRLLNTLYGKTLPFFHSFSIKGWELFLSHFVLSVLEFIFYITPLYYFISISLENASKLLSNSGLSENFFHFWFSSVGKSSLLFMLCLVAFYLFIVILPFFFSTKSTTLYLLMFVIYPISCFLLYRIALLSGWENVFFAVIILLMGVFNFVLIRNFFMPYFDRGE